MEETQEHMFSYASQSRCLDEDQMVASYGLGDIHILEDAESFQTTLPGDQQLGKGFAPCHIIHDPFGMEGKEPKYIWRC